MVDLLFFLVLAVYFIFWSGSDTSKKQASIAMSVYLVYLFVYKIIPPFPVMTTKYDGQLYGFLPLVSLGAILLPHFNCQSSEVVTRTLGWLGIITAIFIMLCFKFYVW
ncbi:hypothetical protein BCT42_02190 [Vibrio lentus]|nr:hypothetical protein A9266_10600 [Vibrio tasmaniensis]PMI39630.1 hypothetical protein BCU45_05095 [Vibrio lentus]PMI65810.1 hypothetical protein BCU40_13800 [Vibrio lentus]PMJ51048.1 hypothetical protein BCU20_10670 [Vibrio lentus]PMN07279.1 hypothetical protein BCT42_02190 [Vibrio lentus]